MHQKDESNDASSQQTPLMTSVSEDDEKLPRSLSNENLTGFSCAKRAARQRLLSFALYAFPFFGGVLLTVLLLAITGLLHTNSTSHSFKLPEIISGTDEKTGQPAHWFNGSCGNSVAEAKSRDCVFDLVSHSWLPQDCLYEEDIADAELMYANDTWHWGLDDTTEVSLEEVQKGGFDRVWTSMDWHITHCGFIWKRLHRVLQNPERKLDSYTADYHHTSHCVGMIAGLSPIDAINATGTRVYTKFPTCS